MIIHKPRQIIIDLDPDQGFPVNLRVESRTLVIENDVELTELPPHIESMSAGTPEAETVLGKATAEAINALKTYQDEVQRLAAQLLELKAQPTTPE